MLLLVQATLIAAYSDCSSAIKRTHQAQNVLGPAIGHLQHGSLLLGMRHIESTGHSWKQRPGEQRSLHSSTVGQFFGLSPCTNALCRMENPLPAPDPHRKGKTTPPPPPLSAPQPILSNRLKVAHGQSLQYSKARAAHPEQSKPSPIHAMLAHSMHRCTVNRIVTSIGGS